MLLLSGELTDVSVELPEGIAIRSISPDELDILAEINPDLHMPLEVSKAEKGFKCYVASMGGRPAAYGWVQASGVADLEGTGRRLRLKPTEIWLLAHYTAVWARGNRIHGLIQRSIMADYCQKGYRKVWLTKSDTNTASIRSGNRVGFVVERKLRSLQIRGLCLPLP
jgi:hypothetical protein